MHAVEQEALEPYEVEQYEGGNVVGTAMIIGAVEIAIGLVSWLLWRRATG
jgi:hypothetical protein